MSKATLTESPSPDAVEILFDLMDEDLLGLLPGERLWKLYCFRKTDHASRLRHRIYTKQKANGRLELITFAAHNPLNVSDDAGAVNHAPAIRSALARVPDLSASDLDRLVVAMRAQTPADECDEIDLTIYPSLDEQLARLQAEASRKKSPPREADMMEQEGMSCFSAERTSKPASTTRWPHMQPAAAQAAAASILKMSTSIAQPFSAIATA